MDAQERLKVLGIDATEKLHEALHDPGQIWSKRELMELVDLTLQPGGGKSGSSAAGNGSAPGQVNLEIKFVGAKAAEQSPVVEASFREVP